MLSDFIPKVKYFFATYKNDIYTALLIFMVGMGSFGLGRLSAVLPKKEPIKIERHEPGGENHDATPAPALKFTAPHSGKYVASKNGTAYHYPWCSGAQKIMEENKIWFNTKKEAEMAGYKPAGNCEGL